ncbi:MAG: 4Fe-4S binding protein, partial [Eggerthellaceae bacterium]|nr:4Fe-4S binding protein [Eggerthellaceae bacterium]
MKQLLILSGKGGTGKTTVATALVELSGTRAFADCDVDAPNLHLSTKVCAPSEQADFEGMPRAFVDTSLCTGCGACESRCRFGAIIVHDFAQSLDSASANCALDSVRRELARADSAPLTLGGRRARVDRISCEGCRVCMHVCPEGAINMTSEVTGRTIVHASADEVFSTACLRAGAGNSGKLVAAV